MGLERRTFALVAALSLGAVAFSQHRPLPNSFVDYRIHSVSELVAQVKSDRAVRDRFERHFSMGIDELVNYLSGLHEERLSTAEVFTVYSAPASGYIKMHTQRLKAGTLVFADSHGKPILMEECGNPLTGTPHNPTVVQVERPQPPPQPPLPPAPQPPAPQPPAPQAYVPPTPQPPVEVPPPPPPAPPVVVMPAPPSAPPVETSTVTTNTTTTSVSHSGAGWVFVAAIPLIFVHNSHHSSTTIIEHHRTPTPEPASFLALGLGAAGLLRGRSKKRTV